MLQKYIYFLDCDKKTKKTIQNGLELGNGAGWQRCKMIAVLKVL